MRVNLRLIVGLGIMFGSAATADRVYLTNDRYLDGLIESESRDHITLRVEGGATRITRRRIKEIRYSPPVHAEQIEKEWKRKYFLKEAYVPPRLIDLAERLRALQAQRHQVIRAQRSLEGAAQREEQLRMEFHGINADLAEAGQKLREMDATRDVHAYNTSVTEMNELRNAAALKVDALRALPSLKQGWADLIAHYADALESLRRDAASQHGGGGETGDERVFLNRAMSELALLSGEFETHTASLLSHRAGHAVEVHINQTTTGHFIVDTGAAIVTMSEAFAKRAGLEWDAAQTMELVLANGESAQGIRIMLDHVAVGGVSARGVPAVILANAPDEDVDGLLGMSFLGRFQFSMEPGHGRLTFRDFVAGE
ncbi:MAG: retroviral-like aspartic protease family protein [Lentisphaerae bacterium]|nr:retroviral-like aspartic protease family protein [Lentisphaerota bacterium]